jgi:aspartate aminotransferase
MKIDQIKPTAAVALADIARNMELQGHKVIKLQTGDPDFATHPTIIEAAMKALKAGQTHYSFSQGLPHLRDAIANEISTEIKHTITKENIVITNGAAEGIYAVMASLLELDDELIILEPNWPTVDSLAKLVGGKPIKISYITDEEIILESLEKNFSSKTKMLCFNSPNNPTGKVFSNSFLKKICDWAVEKNIYILADEVYRFLQYGDENSTSINFLSKYDKYIFADSFSKKYAMTGWRVGYMVSSNEVVKKINKASQLTITHVAPFVQEAALEALTNNESKEYSKLMKEKYLERYKTHLKTCSNLNLNLLKSSGAFYLYINLGENIDDVTFCNTLLHKQKVCAVPGSAFGESGRGYIRLSYAAEINLVTEGLSKIHELLTTSTYN